MAVYEATREARRMALAESRPVLIEAMTYRIGHHSTSDDSTRYRTGEEIDHWDKTNNPIVRMRGYLTDRGLWDDARDEELGKSSRKQVLDAFRVAEKTKKPPIDELFTDVYAEFPPHLQNQQQHLRDHLAEFGDKYDLDRFETPEEYEAARSERNLR